MAKSGVVTVTRSTFSFVTRPKMRMQYTPSRMKKTMHTCSHAYSGGMATLPVALKLTIDNRVRKTASRSSAVHERYIMPRAMPLSGAMIATRMRLSVKSRESARPSFSSIVPMPTARPSRRWSFGSSSQWSQAPWAASSLQSTA